MSDEIDSIAILLFNDAYKMKLLDSIYFEDRLLPYNNHHYLKSIYIMNKYVVDYAYVYDILINYIGNYDELDINHKQRVSNIIHSSNILKKN
jgi:hypothetical protein